jgi:2-dehydro-3-deoxyphosphogalactonate aldolase
MSMRSEVSSGIPLIAILRGVVPERVVDVANVLYEAGIRTIEVPLNSPDPFASIAALAACGRDDWTIGAGTVLTADDARRTKQAGGSIAVMPNCDGEVIRCSLQLDLQVLPGMATPTEAFDAIRAGAKQLKLFPASTFGPQHLQALRAVLPGNVEIFPVGGVGARNIAEWLAAGAAGFGFGSDIFRPEYDLAEIGRRAAGLVQAVRGCVRTGPEGLSI